MSQQNQIKEKLELQAKVENYPARKFTLKQKIKDGNKGPTFISVATFWGDNNNKEFVLKFDIKYQVDQNERTFISELKEQSKENKLSDNVIRIYDYFEYLDYYVIVMEKYQQDLLSYILKGQLTIIEKLQICLDISLPIYYLHNQYRKHCELTLQNYVKVNDKFKLINFGHLSNKNQNKSIPIEYTAPELLNNSDNLSDKVDIWQLGCLFYQIYDGNQLFQGDQISIKKQIQHHTIDQIGQKISQLNCQPEIQVLMIQMLQPDPNQRINIKEVIDQLKTIQNPNFIQISQKNEQEPIQVKIVSNNQNQVNKQQQQELKLSTQDKQPSNLKQSTQVNENNQKNKNISQESNENSNKMSQDQYKIGQLSNQQPQQIEEKPIIFQQKPQQSHNEEQLKIMKEHIENELHSKFKEKMKAQESKYNEEILKYQNTQNQLKNKMQNMEQQLNDLINQNKQLNQSQQSDNNNLNSVQNQHKNEVQQEKDLILNLQKERLEIENQLKTELPKAFKLFTQNLEKLSNQEQKAKIQNNISDIRKLKKLLNCNEE